jgi:hypothetical protein
VRHSTRATLALLTLGLAACAPRPQPELTATAAPIAPPWSAAAVGRYRIDGARSQVLILVYRAGALAALGHDHVIAVDALSGELSLASSAAASRFECQFPVAALHVDLPADRAAVGPPFEGVLDAASIEGTRSHMLGEGQLEAAHFPLIVLRSLAVHPDTDGVSALVQITVRAHAVQTPLHARLEVERDTVVLQGEFDLTHAQLGLTPYSVALGALRVAESLHVRYRLVAVRVG